MGKWKIIASPSVLVSAGTVFPAQDIERMRGIMTLEGRRI
jgi:hypothetical protein